MYVTYITIKLHIYFFICHRFLVVISHLIRLILIEIGVLNYP